jgi:hypothetical protein
MKRALGSARLGLRTSNPLLVARVHATKRTGAGHAMRCLGVLERWSGLGGRVELWGAVEIDFVRRRAARGGVPIVATPGADASVLIVDTYDAVERVDLGRGSTAGTRVLVDDFGENIPTGYSAVWNPNAYADPSLYGGFGGRAFVGRDFVPVREGLPTWVGGGEGAVSFGGVQVAKRLARLVRALPTACGVSKLQCVGAPLSPYCRPVPPDDIWGALKHAAWLISAAGSTTWEAAVVGIPFVGVITADNHVAAARWVASHGNPVVDLRQIGSIDGVAADLAAAVTRARPLPRLHPGAPAVVREVSALIGWSP